MFIYLYTIHYYIIVKPWISTKIYKTFASGNFLVNPSTYFKTSFTSFEIQVCLLLVLRKKDKINTFSYCKHTYIIFVLKNVENLENDNLKTLKRVWKPRKLFWKPRILGNFRVGGLTDYKKFAYLWLRNFEVSPHFYGDFYISAASLWLPLQASTI